MSEEGWEQKYVKESFDTNWVVPLGPNVNAFEKDLEEFISSTPNPSELGTVPSAKSKTSAFGPVPCKRVT